MCKHPAKKPVQALLNNVLETRLVPTGDELAKAGNTRDGWSDVKKIDDININFTALNT